VTIFYDIIIFDSLDVML